MKYKIKNERERIALVRCCCVWSGDAWAIAVISCDGRRACAWSTHDDAARDADVVTRNADVAGNADVTGDANVIAGDADAARLLDVARRTSHDDDRRPRYYRKEGKVGTCVQRWRLAHRI